MTQNKYGRRSLLKKSLGTSFSMTAYASLGNLFSGDAFAQSFPPSRNLIWINMNGGWDLLEVTDPKSTSTSYLDVSYDYAESNLLTGSSDGTRLGRFLPGLAALGEDLLVVRGLAMGTTSHQAGRVYMDTGILSNTGRVNAASIPAIVASESGATIPIIQLNGGSDPAIDRGLLKPVSVVRASNLALYRAMYPESKAAIDRKMSVLDYLRDSIARHVSVVGESDRLTGLSAAHEKVRAQFADNVGSKLALTEADRAPFLSSSSRGQSGVDAVALALKLINNEIVTCVNLGFGGFDTHQNQTMRLQPVLENIDFLLSALVKGLKDSQKLASTLIVLYSDFGRTPRVNNGNGRDHWPVGGCIVIGGGILGGRAVGATDQDLQAAELIDPDSGLVTTDSGKGLQINPTHIGGMVLELTLGSAYQQYRPYLPALPALTRLKG